MRETTAACCVEADLTPRDNRTSAEATYTSRYRSSLMKEMSICGDDLSVNSIDAAELYLARRKSTLGGVPYQQTLIARLTIAVLDLYTSREDR